LAAVAADYPTPKPGDWTAHDFRFHTGEILRELRLHYTTVGELGGEPVLVLHGTTGSDASMLTPAFAGDARKYFIILPDAIGAGQSSRPSDGLRTKFLRYNYDDMVAAQIHAHLAWMLRRMLIDAIRSDPDWKDGYYTTQPRALRSANVFFSIAPAAVRRSLYQLAPNRAQADRLVAERLAAPFTADANDFLYQWDASRDYNPAPMLERITAALLTINSADDERNPPELGILEPAIKRIRNARYYLVPAGPDTRGHGTTAMAKF
jgi:homoserine O-acetyltransferase